MGREASNGPDDQPGRAGDPPLARRFLSDTRFAWIWVAARVYLGVAWITTGISLLTTASPSSPLSTSQLASNPVVVASPLSTQGLQDIVGASALIVGLLLLLGAYTGITSFVSIILGMNTWYPGPTSADPVAIVLAMLLILAWRIDGWYGLDRWLLTGPGVPRLISVVRTVTSTSALRAGGHGSPQESHRRFGLLPQSVARSKPWRSPLSGSLSSISRKVTVSLALLLGLVTAQAIITLVLLTNAVDGSAQLVSPALARVDHLAHAEADLLRLHTVEYSIVWTADNAERQQDLALSNQLRLDIQQNLTAYASLPLDPGRQASLQQFQNDYQAYLLIEQHAFETTSRGDQSAALSEYLSYHPQFERLDEELHQLRHQEYRATENLRDQLVQTVDLARWPLGMVVLLTVAAEVVIGYQLAKSIGRGFRVLEEGTKRIAQENFVEPVPVLPERELATLANSLNSVMVTLSANKAERNRLEEERLRLVKERLNQVVQAQEAERARISRELHDQAGQAVTGLQYGLTRVQHLVTDPQGEAEVERLVTLAEQAGHQISALARELRPSILDHLGLLPAIRSYVREYSERIGIPVQLTTTARIPRLSADAETALFRVIQEALTNVAKHSGARQARVDIEIRDDDLALNVSDDGCGFNPDMLSSDSPESARRQSHLGLLGMRERIQLLGGRIDLDSRPGGGTRLQVRIPLTGNLGAARTSASTLVTPVTSSV